MYLGYIFGIFIDILACNWVVRITIPMIIHQGILSIGAADAYLVPITITTFRAIGWHMYEHLWVHPYHVVWNMPCLKAIVCESCHVKKFLKKGGWK
ncbi:hypothetical protein F5Y02DRAFT_306112 [Annulohypoxylon stygium]|nr:hypothetical protein F5Y02DRAFT_306112 [Annulohypoxylon stygium]